MNPWSFNLPLKSYHSFGYFQLSTAQAIDRVVGQTDHRSLLSGAFGDGSGDLKTFRLQIVQSKLRVKISCSDKK